MLSTNEVRSQSTTTRAGRMTAVMRAVTERRQGQRVLRIGLVKAGQIVEERIIKSRNVWKHRCEHFNVDKLIQASYREIIERRANEINRDHINGIGHAVTTRLSRWMTSA